MIFHVNEILTCHLSSQLYSDRKEKAPRNSNKIFKVWQLFFIFTYLYIVSLLPCTSPPHPLLLESVGLSLWGWKERDLSFLFSHQYMGLIPGRTGEGHILVQYWSRALPALEFKRSFWGITVSLLHLLPIPLTGIMSLYVALSGPQFFPCVRLLGCQSEAQALLTFHSLDKVAALPSLPYPLCLQQSGRCALQRRSLSLDFLAQSPKSKAVTCP